MSLRFVVAVAVCALAFTSVEAVPVQQEIEEVDLASMKCTCLDEKEEVIDASKLPVQLEDCEFVSTTHDDKFSTHVLQCKESENLKKCTISCKCDLD